MSLHILPPTSADPDRFSLIGEDLVRDAATGLFWPRSANPLGFPFTWAEALAAVGDLNHEAFLGHTDWRMPNRRELRSLIDHGEKQPALPAGHPFREVFPGWVWTATTKAGQERYAWNVHFEGGRMFYSRKDDFRLLWPVRGASGVLPQTGQKRCFNEAGLVVDCHGTGQDGELRAGAPWPEPRLEPCGAAVTPGVADRLTGLCWMDPARLPGQVLTWHQAHCALGDGWRLPEINELESLVDAARANPALPEPLRLAATVEGLWSATASGFDRDWAYVLYVQKGAVGVGFKNNRDFHAWPVRTLGEVVR